MQITGIVPGKCREREDIEKRAGNRDGAKNKGRGQRRRRKKAENDDGATVGNSRNGTVPQKMAKIWDDATNKGSNGDGTAKRTGSGKQTHTKRHKMVMDFQNKGNEKGWHGKKAGN